MATVLLGIGNDHTVTPTEPSAISGATVDGAWEGTATFSGGVPVGVESGDIMTDDSAVEFCVLSVDSGTVISLRAKAGETTAPTKDDTAAFQRAFNTFTLANDDVADWVDAGDDLIWECHSEGSMPITEAALTITTPELTWTGTFKITVKDGEWHRGVPGSGFIWKPTGAGVGLAWSDPWPDATSVIFERLEIDGEGMTVAAVTRGIKMGANGFGPGFGDQTMILRDIIVHDYIQNAAVLNGIDVIASGFVPVTITNCLVYNLTKSSGTEWSTGFKLAGEGITLANCGVYNVTTDGFFTADGADTIAKNCGSFDAGVEDWRPTGWDTTNSTNCASSDGKAAVVCDSNPSFINLTAADEFASVVGGSEDFNIRPTSALRRAGVDAGLTTDIRGKRLVKTPNIGPYGTQFGGQYLPALLGQERGQE